MSSTLVTRFAPSPTGSLHLGNARTALFNWLWARRSGGRFILRIEDTDVERSAGRFLDELIEDLDWLGLQWDEGPRVGGPNGPYLQSQRADVYRRYFEELEGEGRAYPCYCTAQELELSRKLQRMAGQPPRYAGTCRHLSAAQRAEREARGLKPTLRFAVPAAATLEWVDFVHGPQVFAAAEIGDFIIRREDGTAAFFFSNAVDDALMGVTHVLRGDDHLTNTPRQMLLLAALGLRVPGYGHVGLLIGEDGAPLSKRHGSASVRDFRERGFLPEALLNHLLRLGHASDVDGWLTLEEMPAHFRPEHLGRAAARFEESQLMHWQREAVQRMSPQQVRTWLGSSDSSDFLELIRHNVVLPADAAAWTAIVHGELPPLGDDEQRMLDAAGPGFFVAALEALAQAGTDLKRLTQILKERSGRKGAELYMPLRIALTGREHGPELAPLLKLIGPDKARARLESHAHHP
ncbi:MAG TPA: glutamate--tRNA ligase [Steroidobacteraceae bacterium]|nr:glutamate--tRNA ligase [Steroidobacteraceae bacterium]